MGFSPKYHFLTNQSRRKPHWSVSSNNKAMVTLPEVTLYKSHKKKSPLAIEITEIRKEPGFTNSVHPQLPGAQRVSNSRALEGHSFGSHKALASAGLTQLQWALLCSGRCKALRGAFPKGKARDLPPRLWKQSQIIFCLLLTSEAGMGRLNGVKHALHLKDKERKAVFQQPWVHR